MNMRATGAYPAGMASPTDKRIGDAFPIIEAVYKELDKLKYIAEHSDKFAKRDIELRANMDLQAIEWRYKDQEDWLLLVTFSDLVQVDLLILEQDLHAAVAEAQDWANHAREVTADVDKIIAETHQARDQAIAAASSTGIFRIFKTKAEAEANIVAVPVGRYIEVLADESYNGYRTRYEKTVNGYEFAVNLDASIESSLRSVVRTFPDYAAASAAAATLPDGQRIEILSDATHSNLITRYEVQGGALVYNGLAFDASSELFKPYFEGAVSRTTREKLEEHISIADFGATGVDDSARDDTDAFIKAAAALAISKSKRLYIPKGVYRVPDIGAGVLIPAGTQVFGDGEGVTIIKDPVSAANRSIFIAGGNSIVISDMTLEGGQGTATTAYYENSVAIRNENDGTDYEGIVVQRVEARGWGDGGVRLWRPKRCRVEGSNLHDLGRFGVFMFGGEDNRIWFNQIKSIKPGNGGVPPFINAYGFSFSCDVSEPGFPKSKNCVAAFNMIEDVPTWEAMDIHGGDGIDILFNTVTDCMIGLFAGPASGANNVALDNCRIHGNRLKTSTTYRRGGIIVAPTYAVGTVYGKNIQVTQNTIDGFGKNQATHDAGFASLEGALHIVGVDGVDVSLNTVINFNCAGVYVRQRTLAAKVFDNTVRNGEPANSVSTAYIFETNTSVFARFARNSAIKTSGSEFTAFDILGGGGTGDFGIRMDSNNDFTGMAVKFGASARGRLHPSSQEKKTIRAWAYVTNNGTTATIAEGSGFAGVTRASAGLVTLTLAEAAPSANYGIFPTYRGGQARFATAGNNTATTFDVFVWDLAGALIDGAFYVEVVW